MTEAEMKDFTKKIYLQAKPHIDAIRAIAEANGIFDNGHISVDFGTYSTEMSLFVNREGRKFDVSKAIEGKSKQISYTVRHLEREV